jgi:hypothetical protein
VLTWCELAALESRSSSPERSFGADHFCAHDHDHRGAACDDHDHRGAACSDHDRAGTSDDGAGSRVRFAARPRG